MRIKTSLKISKRLETIANFIAPGEKFADIGSDHGYVPCYVCLLNNNNQAIATELNNGPYESAKQMVESLQLSQLVDMRLGNGFEPIEKDEIDTAIVAGMGGSLITSILNADVEKVKTVKKLILQPNIDENEVRCWLYANGFKIVDETILEEKKHIYEIIIAERSESNNLSQLTEKEYFFGPILLEGKSATFIKKWRQKYGKTEAIIRKMERVQVNTDHLVKFRRELQWMEGILKDDTKSTDI